MNLFIWNIYQMYCNRNSHDIRILICNIYNFKYAIIHSAGTHDLHWSHPPVWSHVSDVQESDSTHWRETELKLFGKTVIQISLDCGL